MFHVFHRFSMNVKVSSLFAAAKRRVSCSYEAKNGEIAEITGEIPVETQPRRVLWRWKAKGLSGHGAAGIKSDPTALRNAYGLPSGGALGRGQRLERFLGP